MLNLNIKIQYVSSDKLIAQHKMQRSEAWYQFFSLLVPQPCRIDCVCSWQRLLVHFGSNMRQNQKRRAGKKRLSCWGRRSDRMRCRMRGWLHRSSISLHSNNQIKNVTEIFIKLDFGDQTEVEMRRTWTILLSAGTTTRTRCEVGINFLSDNIRSDVHLRREAKAYLTMVMLFSRDFEAVSVNRSFCMGICNKEQDSTIAWTKESSTARQKTIEW